jgi:two-component system, OmpR family, sensor histidine kinase KdpD
MALRQTAYEVEARQDGPAPEPENPERILIHVTEAPATVALIRRGKRVADYLGAECFAVAVTPSPDPAQLDRHLEFARKLHIETRVLESHNPAEALVDFARRNSVTQLFLSKPAKRGIPFFGKRPLVMDIVRLAQDRQVTVVAERRHN